MKNPQFITDWTKVPVGSRVHLWDAKENRLLWEEDNGDRFYVRKAYNKESAEIEQIDAHKTKASAAYPTSVAGGRGRFVLAKEKLAPVQKPVTTKTMKTTSAIAAIIAASGTINAVVDGKTYSIGPDSLYYAGAKAALRSKNAVEFVKQCDLDKSVRARSNGKVTYTNGTILWNGQPVNNALTGRIYQLIKQDFEFESLLNLLENIMKNPDQRAIDELYLFLEANTLPITEDGCFLAYRRVNKDYLSIHANPDGTRNRNKIGDVVEMPRAKVNANRDITCSTGLHFASLSYIPHYGSSSNGDRTMIVKINPADVVSIPSDYANQKGRCCKYTVVAEHLDGDTNDTLSANAVYEVSATGIKPSGQKYHAVRDPQTGRFTRQ